MVFRTDQIRRDFKYKSTTNTTPTPTTPTPTTPTPTTPTPTTPTPTTPTTQSNDLGSLGYGPSYGPKTTNQPNWSLSNLFNFSGSDDKRYKLDKAASAVEDKYYSDQGATSAPGGTYLNEDGSGINVGTTPKEIVMDKAAADAKAGIWNGDSYLGAPAKMNVGSDGLVKHDGYKNLDINNIMVDKSQPRPYVKGMEAKGISSNDSMVWHLPGTKQGSAASNTQFQKNKKEHIGMVDVWQKGFLTSSSRDQTSASHWLNQQLGKIDSMEGQDKNKQMFKKDLTARYDNLFNSRNAPFGENSSTAYRVSGSTGDERRENKRINKESEALRVSELAGWDYKSVQNPKYAKNKPNTEKSLAEEYSDGTFGQV